MTLRSIMDRLHTAGLPRILAFCLILGTVPSVAATFLAITVSGPGAPDPKTIEILLGLDVLLLLGLGAVVVGRIWRVMRRRAQGVTGARLQMRLIVLFAVVAMVPSLVMSVGSGLFLRYGMESWFSDRVRTAVETSLEVATAYLAEHQQVIGGDALAMANDISREGATLLGSPKAFNNFVSTQAAIRGLSEAIVFDSQGQILAKSGLAFSIELGLAQIPIWAFEKAKSGEPAVLTSEDDQRVRALVRLNGLYGDTYLYVGRFVDPKVLAHLERTSAAAAEYERAEGRRSGLELAFSLVFAVIAMLLLTSVVWVGMSLASNLAEPIVNLIDATEKVRSGDLSGWVTEGEGDEMGQLSRAFNRMTRQLEQQRNDLDGRRRFIETVLDGVSAGVIGLDAEGRVTVTNPSACALLDLTASQIIGQNLGVLVPEFAQSIVDAKERQIRTEISLNRKDRRSRTLLLRVAAETPDKDRPDYPKQAYPKQEHHQDGYVVTFDDISELAMAQRKAAWSDVARRIAHEIKNPLTPIQLSAERLKRKYAKEIHSDPATYNALIETIIRQVGDIGRMVDEFSSFARMPQPRMKEDDLVDICRQAVFMQRTGYPEISFETDFPNHPQRIVCDGILVGQALTNLLKNAVESIGGREAPPPEGQTVEGQTVERQTVEQGRIRVQFTQDERHIRVEVIDNGRGLPTEGRDRLTEPYVTTRAKGTGLGLAIVKKIMEDHGGDLILEDGKNGGATVVMIFPTISDSFHGA